MNVDNTPDGFIRYLSRLPADELRNMRESALAKARQGITRKNAHGFNPEERAQLYELLLIGRGESL